MKQLAIVLNCLLLLGADGPELKVSAEHDVDVPMRDGVVLRANVFRPDRGGPYPVLVMRTPYGKRSGGFDRLWLCLALAETDGQEAIAPRFHSVASVASDHLKRGHITPAGRRRVDEDGDSLARCPGS